MRILFVSDYFPPEPNAAATRVHEHVRRWAAAGHEVVVVSSVPNFPQGRLYPGYRNLWSQMEEMDGVRVVRVKTFVHPNRGRWRRILDQASFLPTASLAVFREAKPDVILASSPTLFAALAAAIAARLRRVPFVLEIGDLASASISAVGVMRKGLMLRTVEWLEHFVYRSAARIVVQTPSMKQAVLVSGTPPENVSEISNGVDMQRFGGIPGKHDKAGADGSDTFVAGYIGTIGMAHGLGSVLEAAEKLRDNPRIRFLLVGDGAERPVLEEAAEERGLDNVVFDGPYPHKDIPGLWATLDIALVCLRDHPTFRTVVPSKIFEAMATGVPLLLAAPKGEATALVARFGTGTIIPPEDPDALAEGVLRLCDDSASLVEQSRNSRLAARNFDRDGQAARYLELLDEVVSAWKRPDR